MTAHSRVQLQKSFIEAIHSCSHTDCGNSARHKGERTEAPLPFPSPPPPRSSTVSSPKRPYTFKQTEETVIVRTQLSCTVHLVDCWGTKGPLLMRPAACEWEVRRPWPFPWLWIFNLPSTHPGGSDNAQRNPRGERAQRGGKLTLMASVLCVNPLLSACSLC